MDQQWGTPFKLLPNDVVTTRNGKLVRVNEFCQVEVETPTGSLVFNLPPDQEVLVSNEYLDLEFLRAADIRAYEHEVILLREPLLTLGDHDFRNLSYLLGVLAFTYDAAYQSIVGYGIPESTQRRIEAAIPQAVQELDLEITWPTYPKFVRGGAANTTWTLTSPAFKTILQRCAELGLIQSASNPSIIPELWTLSAVKEWMKGFYNVYAPDEQAKIEEGLESWEYLRQRTHTHNWLGEVGYFCLSDSSSLPVLVGHPDFYEVLSTSVRTDAELVVYQFPERYWICPSGSATNLLGLICRKTLQSLD